MNQVDVFSLHAPSRTNAKVTQFGGLVRGVPTLEYLLEFGRQLRRSVSLEPFHLHQAAAQGGRGLLILASEVVFPHRFADTLQYLQRFSLQLKRFAGTTPEIPFSERCLNHMGLIFFGN